MGIKQWKLPHTNSELAARLSRESGQPEFLCRILAARGVTDAAEIARFVGETVPLDDPMRMAGMKEAVCRIQQAMEDGERICVYGDYDCDGVTSTALLVSYFQSVGADVIYYVPNREKEGYGLNRGALDMLAGQQVSLVVTVDNGISAHGEIEHASGLGIDVVVTDHHTPRETLPPAVAVVNPHRADCPSRFKALAGVGVAFKLICALEGENGEELLEYYSDLVAIGTVADVVPLIGENRTIVRHGLQRIADTDHLGISALLEVSGLRERALTSEALAFGIIPRINAAGRVGVADDVVELLLTDDPGVAEELAERVAEQNTARKKLEEDILTEIDRILEQNPAILNKRVLIVSGHGWHHGVAGIVSAKLMERFDKPCIVFSEENGEARGSGRSIKGFSLIEAISACSESLTRYGGHTLAAGLTLPVECLPEFEQALQSYAGEHYAVMPVSELAADCTLPPEDLTVGNVSLLNHLEPFGAGNESPLFHLPGLVIAGVYPTADHKHIRVRLTGGGGSFYAVWFGVSDFAFPYRAGDPVEVLARVNVQEYNGKQQLSVKISDLRPAGVPQERVLLGKERYARYLRQEPPEEGTALDMLPQREEIALVYRFLRKVGSYAYGADALYIHLMQSDIDYCRLLLALDVLMEMGFITRAAANGASTYQVVPDAPRADLADSAILRRLAALLEPAPVSL